jgi:type IV pilus assembly protein PilE
MMKISRIKGFTLIELMLVVAIISILASIAYPSYIEYILRSKRGDGKATILAAQLAQEKYRANNTTYLAISTAVASQNGYYSYQVSSVSGTNYTITATPNFTDSTCGNLIFTVSGGTETKSVSSSSGSLAECWKK